MSTWRHSSRTNILPIQPQTISNCRAPKPHQTSQGRETPRQRWFAWRSRSPPWTKILWKLNNLFTNDWKPRFSACKNSLMGWRPPFLLVALFGRIWRRTRDTTLRKPHENSPNHRRFCNASAVPSSVGGAHTVRWSISLRTQGWNPRHRHTLTTYQKQLLWSPVAAVDRREGWCRSAAAFDWRSFSPAILLLLWPLFLIISSSFRSVLVHWYIDRIPPLTFIFFFFFRSVLVHNSTLIGVPPLTFISFLLFVVY